MAPKFGLTKDQLAAYERDGYLAPIPIYTEAEMAEIRGPGFMVAVEFITNGVPDADLTNRIRLEALNRGLVLLTCGVYANVIRFLAPLTIDEAHFTEALDILEAAIKAARGA